MEEQKQRKQAWNRIYRYKLYDLCLPGWALDHIQLGRATHYIYVINRLSYHLKAGFALLARSAEVREVSPENKRKNYNAVVSAGIW